MIINQIMILCVGLFANWLSQSPNKSTQRWTCIIALLISPFWLWASYHAQQWGIFTLCIIDLALWTRGFKTYWRKHGD